jgi:hypothetical protein
MLLAFIYRDAIRYDPEMNKDEIYLSRFPACQTSFKIKPCDEAIIYLNDENNY